MCGSAACDERSDPALRELAAVNVVVVATVGDQPCWPVTRTADTTAHVRDRIDQREQLRDVVAIRRRRGPGEQDAIGVDQDVVLDTSTAAIDRTRPQPEPPFFACT
jgi:hypothetical protein